MTPWIARPVPGAGRNAPVADADLCAYAKRIYRLRRARDERFPGLFGEPAWDILLELFVARMEGRRTYVSSLCVAAAVPTTTALRWISTLVDSGDLAREESGTDRRRSYVSITDSAFERMSGLLEYGVRNAPG